MHDICDGALFKENGLFQEHSNGLQIQFYYDDVEVCNPLGSKAKVHKLGNSLNYYMEVLVQDGERCMHAHNTSQTCSACSPLQYLQPTACMHFLTAQVCSYYTLGNVAPKY